MFKDRPEVRIDVKLKDENEALSIIRKSMLDGQCCSCGRQIPQQWPPFDGEERPEGWVQMVPDPNQNSYLCNPRERMPGHLFLIFCPDCVSDGHDVRMEMELEDPTRTMVELAEADEDALTVTIGGLSRSDIDQEMYERIEAQVRSNMDEDDYREVVLMFSEDSDTVTAEKSRIWAKFSAMRAERARRERACGICGSKRPDRSKIGVVYSDRKKHSFRLCDKCWEEGGHADAFIEMDPHGDFDPFEDDDD